MKSEERKTRFQLVPTEPRVVLSFSEALANLILLALLPGQHITHSSTNIAPNSIALTTIDIIAMPGTRLMAQSGSCTQFANVGDVGVLEGSDACGESFPLTKSLMFKPKRSKQRGDRSQQQQQAGNQGRSTATCTARPLLSQTALRG
jgi:hypothetical protein